MRQLLTPPPPIASVAADISGLDERLSIVEEVRVPGITSRVATLEAKPAPIDFGPRIAAVEDDIRVSANLPDLNDQGWKIWIQSVQNLAALTITTCFNVRALTGEVIELLCRTDTLPSPSNNNATPTGKPGEFTQTLQGGLTITYETKRESPNVSSTWPAGFVTWLRWTGLDSNQLELPAVNGSTSPFFGQTRSSWTLPPLAANVAFIRWEYATSSGLQTYIYPTT